MLDELLGLLCAYGLVAAAALILLGYPDTLAPLKPQLIQPPPTAVRRWG